MFHPSDRCQAPGRSQRWKEHRSKHRSDYAAFNGKSEKNRRPCQCCRIARLHGREGSIGDGGELHEGAEPAGASHRSFRSDPCTEACWLLLHAPRSRDGSSTGDTAVDTTAAGQCGHPSAPHLRSKACSITKTGPSIQRVVSVGQSVRLGKC